MQNDQIIQQILPFKSKFYRFALKIVGNDEDAEDVIQEMLVKVWQKSELLHEIENKEAWCMTVTRNLCIDKIRRRKKNRSNDIDEYFSISDRGPTPDKITEDKESLSIVMGTLNALPESQKEIIHLRDIEGYTYREISNITGMTEDQVKVNLFRARQKLKYELRNFSY